MSFAVKIEYLGYDEHLLGKFSSLSIAQEFVSLWFLGQTSKWIPQTTTLLDDYPEEYGYYKKYYKTIHFQWACQDSPSEFLIIAEAIDSSEF